MSLNIYKSNTEHFGSRYWVENWYLLDNSIEGREVFSDVSPRGAELKALNRLNYVLTAYWENYTLLSDILES
jgi:hypothetical protein